MHLAIARRHAAHPDDWPFAPRFDPLRRWYHRLAEEPGAEVWLLTWLPGQETDLHDHGGSAGALGIERNVLEWRLDPRSDARLPVADRYDLPVIIACQEGYTSSLAAAALHDLGLRDATDLEGGFAAWQAAGLPVTHEHEGVRS